MIGSYEITYHGNPVGNIIVHNEGLYYLFEGWLVLPEDKMWRVSAESVEIQIDLGICLLESQRWTIRKKLPVKLFGKSKWEFKAEERYAVKTDHALETQPFDNLDQIEKGRVISGNDGTLLIVYTDK